MQLPSDTLQLIATLASLVGSSGAAWVGVKVSLNGTRERVKEIHQDVKELRTEQGDLGRRVAVLEDRSPRRRKATE